LSACHDAALQKLAADDVTTYICCCILLIISHAGQSFYACGDAGHYLLLPQIKHFCSSPHIFVSHNKQW
jgi:hypothetical protein